MVFLVGVEHKTLPVPEGSEHPTLVQLLRECCDADPRMRPSFEDIVDRLDLWIRATSGSRSTLAAPASSSTISDGKVSLVVPGSTAGSAAADARRPSRPGL